MLDWITPPPLADDEYEADWRPEEEVDFEVRHYQKEFWGALIGQYADGTPCRQYKRGISICHRRYGKDELTMRAAFIASQIRPGNYWHCLPKLEQCKKAIWYATNPHTGKRRIDECFPDEFVKRNGKKASDLLIEFENGSTWQLIGSDNYNSAVGSSPCGIVFSEWALAMPEAYAYFSPMIVDNDGWAWFITTPRGKNHAYRMFEAAKHSQSGRDLEEMEKVLTEDELKLFSDEPDWYYELADVYQTRALNLVQIRQVIRDYAAIYGPEAGNMIFEQEYECDFSGISTGSYFGAYLVLAEREGRICDFEIDRSKPVHTSWDLGKAENNPIFLFQYSDDPDYPIDIVDFYRPAAMSDLRSWCDWLDAHGYNGFDFVPHDILVTEWGGIRTRMDMLKDMGRNPVRVNRVSFEDGISAGIETIRKCRFRNTKRVREALEDLRNFMREWDDENQTYKPTPKKDKAEHVGSSWRYLSLAWREKAELPGPKGPKGPAPEVWNINMDGTVACNLTTKEQVERMVAEGRDDDWLEDDA